MSLLCIALLGSGLAWELPLPRFELVWTHSVEKVEWRETWAVEPAALRLETVRVKGSGAGMEPPDGSVLEAGWWVAHPGTALTSVTLTRSGVVQDYRFCVGADCRPLTAWLPELPETGSIQLTPCG